MTIQNIRNIINKNRKFLKEKYKIKSMSIFGSIARDEGSTNSDVDVLVEFNESPDMFEFIKLEQFLENLLGAKVDLVTKKALKPLIKDKILKEAVYL
ncbi:MAG: nucleotidyltransferase family protein [Candidatus Omnitrophica bacterium]|nr:nucleotidyltransferase family protein [Candidatus Omnitrophota bacterium]